ncbi:methyltransferase-like protein 25B isoform X1 [Rhopilema esculentum]|uniref:methyltransferase-like protein 25B isoform X1 n=1 Tax=Rhopilema esculentum TaxID=499914 RepID=UPI0031D43CD6
MSEGKNHEMEQQMEWNSSTLPLSAEEYLQKQQKFIENYKWLVNSFLAEFFAEGLWERIPLSWRICLEKISIDEFHDLISPDVKGKNFSCVLPLSLLSFIALCHYLALPRKQMFNECTQTKDSANDTKLPHSFRRHVKIKKQYEVKHLSQLIKTVADHIGCNQIADVGGGLGHLSRYLAFVHHLQVVTIESEGHHKMTAEKFDKETLRDIQRSKLRNTGKPQDCDEAPPIHVTKMVPLDISADEFVNIILSARRNSPAERFQDENESMPSENRTFDDNKQTSTDSEENKENYVLVGLHTCGDLSPTMIRTFVNCEGAKAIVLISCCYMKLTCNEVEMNFNNLSISEEGNRLPAKHVQTNCSCNSASCSEDLHFETNSPDGKHNNADDASKKSAISEDTGLSGCCCTNHEGRNNVIKDKTDQIAPKHTGFPMSHYLRRQSKLSVDWDGLELACHNLDNYCQRLLDEKEKLKIQCYRAALEVVIRKLRPDMKNPQIRCQKIKGASRLSFQEYAHAALQRINISKPSQEIFEELDINSFLSRWKEVTMFYCLRLLIGPVIESMVLTDRLLYMQENGFRANLYTVFDAKISPRNFALVSFKD